MADSPAVSLVVVCYEMGRELPRTLLSLSPAYQAYPRENYEIIVVDNGSRSPPRAEDFAALGADLRILSCSDPMPSPVRAVNLGISLASTDLIGVWIDGARMASPGVIRACVAAAALHPRAVIATLNYQLGPALQWVSVDEGYNQAVEDGLLASIDWPKDGYRLFEIASPELRTGPLGPMRESNGLFMPRALWTELGGYAEAFTEPGGGIVNLDTLIRAVDLPDVQFIRILGEGTFHQIHGGLSTGPRQQASDLMKQWTRFYARLRGKPLVAVRETGWTYDSRTGIVNRSP